MISSANEIEFVAIRAWAVGRTVFMELTDGRQIGFPAARFLRLACATDEQLAQVKLRLGGCAALGRVGRRHRREGCRAWAISGTAVASGLRASAL